MNHHDRYSIFGDTYKGVPNPMVPHKHPYPTRYHGPVFEYPTPGWGYNMSPYARVPFDGDDDKLLGVSKLLIGGLVAAAVAGGAIYLLTRGGK